MVSVLMTLTGDAPGAGQTWTDYLNTNKAGVQAALASECDVAAQFVTGLEISKGANEVRDSTVEFAVDIAQPVELLQDT